MMAPLVSVIVLSYNNKIFLEECIGSILLQDHTSIEIVVADDHSTDGSVELLQQLQSMNPGKLKLLLAEKNQGITVNSNLAVKACSGKYVAWMGSDDVMLPGKLSKQVAYMETHPECNIVYHNLEVFESGSNKILYYFNNRRNCHEGGVEKLIRFGTFNGACATMTRSAATPKDGLNTQIPVASDWLYWIEHLVNGGEIRYLDEILGRYRRHDTNVTSLLSEHAKQGYQDMITTCMIVMEKYPEYKSDVHHRLSDIYRSARKIGYIPNLRKSIRYNFFNVPSWGLLILYYVSFKKLRF